MDFVRNLFPMFQRVQSIVRDGQKQRDLPGVLLGLVDDLRGKGDDEVPTEGGDGPAVYHSQTAQPSQTTPQTASRATARNKAKSVDLPTPVVYHEDPSKMSDKPLPEPARAPSTGEWEMDPEFAPARAAGHQSERSAIPEPARAEPVAVSAATGAAAAAVPVDDGDVMMAPPPVNEAASPPANVEAAPVPAESSEEDKDGDSWFDIDDWGGTAMKVGAGVAAVAGTAAAGMAIRDRLRGKDDEEGDAPAAPEAIVGAAASSPEEAQLVAAQPNPAATQPASQSLAKPGIRLYGSMDAEMYADFTEALAEQPHDGPLVIALTTMDGDPAIARSMADDVRLLRNSGRRDIIFLGKTAVYSPGVLFMAAFPVGYRFLTRATKLMITERKREEPLNLGAGPLRDVAERLSQAQREIQRAINQEEEDFRAISEGSNITIQELREKAPGDWYITASEAKAMGLIAEVV